jgi:hypothetical protein
MNKASKNTPTQMQQPDVHLLPSASQQGELPVSMGKSLRQLGRNEAWLQKFIFDNPSVLGLGDLQGVRRERVQSSGGRLDMLLTEPSSNDMYEVEIMLGETDESHIIRTIEYWDAEKRRWPQRKHTAVLVAERINSRFYNVLHLLSLNCPIIGIQCNALEVDGKTGLHFTRIIDAYVEAEVELDEESSPQDEKLWQQRFPLQVKLAQKLESLAKESFQDVELRFVPQYMAIRGGRYDRVKMWSRKGDRVLIGYRLDEAYFEEGVAACEAARIEPIQKRSTNELQFITDLKTLLEQADLHRQLLRWVNRRDLLFTTGPAGESAPVERSSS